MRYRIVVTDILGYNIYQLQTGWFIFWITLKESVPDETGKEFLERCQKAFPTKDIYIRCKIWTP